jgi:hypothetical protein
MIDRSITSDHPNAPGSHPLWDRDEVPDIPAELVQDPSFARSQGTLILTSAPPESGQLPADTSAWLLIV